MKLKNIISIRGGITLALSLSLFTGCGAKPTIKPVQNDRVQTHSIYVNSFSEISNKSSGYSFELNTFKPLGYDTRTYKTKGSSILFADKMHNKYEINECKNTPATVLIVNIIGAPFVLGFNLLAGGMCDHRHSFDYLEFDKDAKEWVEDNDINRKLIIGEYDSLLATQNRKEQLYQDYAVKQTDALNALYAQYYKEYSKQQKKKKHTKDLSSLYKNEVLTSEVTLVENKLDKKAINNRVNYQSQVDSAFPCRSENECVSGMKNSIKSIEQKSSQDMLSLKESSLSTIHKYEKTLQKQTESLTVTYPKDLRHDTFKDKTVYYKLLSKDKVKSKAKKLDVTYKIIAMEYDNVYPAYKNKNSELAISFNPKTKVLTYENLTAKYIQLNSINLYYNNDIYTVTDNQNKNYSTELSPEAFKNLKITQVIKESTYKNITKKKALAKKIVFGFSVKYTVGDSSKNKTLYKRDKTNLYSLIKDR